MEPDSLSTSGLKAVYFPNTDIASAGLGSNASWIWRPLCEGRDMLKSGRMKNWRYS
jgi:hypothetical protein